MSFAANTWIKTVTPSNTTDDYGDPVAVPTPADDAPRYKALLKETTRQVYDETTTTLRTIRFATGKVVRGRPEVAANDVWTDQKTGKTWVIDEVIDIPRTSGGTSDVTVYLRDTTGA